MNSHVRNQSCVSMMDEKPPPPPPQKKLFDLPLLATGLNESKWHLCLITWKASWRDPHRSSSPAHHNIPYKKNSNFKIVAHASNHLGVNNNATKSGYNAVHHIHLHPSSTAKKKKKIYWMWLNINMTQICWFILFFKSFCQWIGVQYISDDGSGVNKFITVLKPRSVWL